MNELLEKAIDTKYNEWSIIEFKLREWVGSGSVIEKEKVSELKKERTEIKKELRRLQRIEARELKKS